MTIYSVPYFLQPSWRFIFMNLRTVLEWFDETIEYLTAYKHKLQALEEQHRQMKETHERNERQLLMERASHEDTRLQLQNTRSVQERTQQELEGKVDMWRTLVVTGIFVYSYLYSDLCTHIIILNLSYTTRNESYPACLNQYLGISAKVWAEQVMCIRPL